MKAESPSKTAGLLFAASGFDLPGGISNLSGSVLGALDELAAEERLSRVDVVALHDKSAPLRQRDSGKSYAAGGSKARFITTFVRLVAMTPPDLVLFDHVGLARTVRKMPGKLRPRYGVMVHGLELQEPVRPSSRAVLDNAAIVLANSKHTAARAVRLAGPQIASKIEVVSPCISRDRIDAWSAAKKGPKRSDQVVIVGRLDARQPGKGHEALLEAWTTIVSSKPSARLVIAGDGNKRPVLEQLVDELGIGGTVRFAGRVSCDQLGELYSGSAMYAMPSSQEGFGIVFAEATWHSLPCIGSDTDASGEVIVDGETEILVPFGDSETTANAILKLLANKDLAAAMGQAGRERCLDLFTADAFKERLCAALERVDASQ